MLKIHKTLCMSYEIPKILFAIYVVQYINNSHSSYNYIDFWGCSTVKSFILLLSYYFIGSCLYQYPLVSVSICVRICLYQYRLVIIIIIITVLRPFFHTEARVRRYQQLSCSIFAYSVRPPFLGLTFSCLLPHTHSMSSYPYPSLYRLSPPNSCT